MSLVPDDLKYSEDHEWVKLEGNIATIGITDFAQSELGDIVFVDVDTVGDTLDQGTVFGSVEAVKTVSDLFLPVTGEIIEFNEELNNDPELINNSPYEKGWIVKVQITNPDTLATLLNANDYKIILGE